MEIVSDVSEKVASFRLTRFDRSGWQRAAMESVQTEPRSPCKNQALVDRKQHKQKWVLSNIGKCNYADSCLTTRSQVVQPRRDHITNLKLDNDSHLEEILHTGIVN